MKHIFSVAILGLLAGLAAPAAGQTLIDTFQLQSFVAQDQASLYQPEDGSFKRYALGTELTIELPEAGGHVQSGVARISNFVVPDEIENFGLYWRFTNVPSELVGTVTVNGDLATLDFPSYPFEFLRGTNPENALPGTLDLTFSTTTTTIPAGCDGDALDDNPETRPLDLSTGELWLAAAVCPYSLDNGNPVNEVFFLALRGTVLPEPGSFALWAGALCVALLGRRRAQA